MSSPANQVLQSYIKKFGKLPDQANQLVSYSRTDAEIPTIIYSEAKKSLSKIAKSIKSGKIKKKSFKTSTKWNVGDEVLISKDRTGVLKYIGKVPEMGDDETYYGIELTSGTLGHNDGAMKGKRYFQTTGKRGMFIPLKKLRRKLNKKDKERRNSYHEISGHVKQLQQEYAGDDAAWLYHGNNPAQVSPNTQNLHTLVFETAEPDEEYGYGNGMDDGDNREYEEENDDIKVKKSDRKKKKIIREKKKMKEKSTRERRNTGGSSSSHNSRYRNTVDTSSDSDNGTDDTDISELNDNENKDDPTVKTFDTVLKYILRQKGQYREGLLDVYANPQTHALIVEAFSQMKQLQPAEQAFLWPALLKRWSKYTQR